MSAHHSDQKSYVSHTTNAINRHSVSDRSPPTLTDKKSSTWIIKSIQALYPLVKIVIIVLGKSSTEKTPTSESFFLKSIHS